MTRRHQNALLEWNQKWLAGQGCKDIKVTPLVLSPFTTGGKHYIVRGWKDGREVIADAVSYCNTRVMIRRLSWLLGHSSPHCPALIAFVIPEDMPFDLDIGMTGLSTEVRVVRAKGVRLGWKDREPRRAAHAEYGVWVRIRPRAEQEGP
jgi:hypothetical protein